MYRNSADNTIIYSPDDLILFRESPFACWMERLTLENPGHGILPDPHVKPPGQPPESQARLALTLRAEGRQVVEIAWGGDQTRRQRATIEAMRGGADFIVDGQLALGVLSAPVDLLMRASGASDLGDYCYIPCQTQGENSPDSTFRLSLLADLLHGLQGRLPEHMLVISPGGGVTPMQTDEHIHYLRAVKHRCLRAMEAFRAEALPDPAESARFGRWSTYAGTILKQRALAQTGESGAVESSDRGRAKVPASSATMGARLAVVPRTAPNLTLAEQARQLADDDRGRGRQRGCAPGRQAISAADALKNLEVSGRGDSDSPAQPDGAGSSRAGIRERASDPVFGADSFPGGEPAPLPVDAGARRNLQKAHPLDSPGFSFNPVEESSGNRVGELAPAVSPEREPEVGAWAPDAPDPEPSPAAESAGKGAEQPGEDTFRALPFSDSLMTSNSIFGTGADPDYEA